VIAAADFDRLLDQHVAGDFPGVVAIARGAEVVAWRASGDAHKAESVPNSLGTRFQVASGSKLLTAVAVGQLVDAGRLTLDARLHECVPSGLLGRLDDRITVRHLLTHTSGSTSYFEQDVDPDYEALWRDRPVYRMRGPRDFLPMFTDKPMKFPPGERFEYCDGGFVLLGLVVEEVTGSAFTDHVREAVLGRAGMVDSGYFPADQLPPRTARAYLPGADGGWRTNVFAVPAIGGGDGGAYLTAPDLARMWHALVTYQLLSEPVTRQLLTAQIATGLDEPHGHYGLGVWLGDWSKDSGRLAFVEGADPGVSMISGYFPATDVSVTILANVETPVWRTFKAITNTG
jgi:CubicO group peptidase (beta-lactamase class C family)